MHSSTLTFAVTQMHQAELRAQVARYRQAAKYRRAVRESRAAAAANEPATIRSRGKKLGMGGHRESPRLGDVHPTCLVKTHGIQ